MKKLFLIPLLACFFCIGAYAEVVINIDQANESDREAALRAALQRTDEPIRINLLGDVFGNKTTDISGRFVIPEGANITLNLGSSSLGCEGFGGFEEPEDGIRCYATILNNGTLTLVAEGDGIIIGGISGDWFKTAGIPIVTYGDLTINGGIYSCQDLVEETGVYVGPSVIYGYGSSNIVINGGLFTAGRPAVAPFIGVIHAQGTLIINGGKFYKNAVNGESSPITDALLGEGCSVKTLIGVDWGSGASAPYTGYWIAPNGTVTPSTGTSVSGTKTAMFIENGAEVTIEEGATLRISKDLAFGNSSSKLIIKPTATLIVDDEIVSNNNANIELVMDARSGGYSNLLIKAGQLQETHPKATVTLKPQCYTINSDGEYEWQRFAVPTYLDFDTTNWVNVKNYETAIFSYDLYNGWQRSGSSLHPFVCYDMTINTTNNDAEFKFPCELVGNGNPKLPLNEGWNFYANSYTAPLNLKAWLKDLRTTYRDLVDAVIYAQLNDKSWENFNFADAVLDLIPISELKPMQAFVYRGKVDGEIPLDYDKYVYQPLVKTKFGAPARHDATNEYGDLQYASIVIKDATGDNKHEETVWLYEWDLFAEPEEREGFEVVKFINEGVFNAFITVEGQDYARVATDNLSNKAITLQTNEVTSYQMHFENVNITGYSIYDNLTKELTEITAENTYTFTADPNVTYSNRFVIVDDSFDPETAVENTEVKHISNGIYSLTGVYMGKDINMLPAGVYVVNGKKVVK